MTNSIHYRFSRQSLNHLREAHLDLQRLFQEVIRHYDCKVIEGHRSENEQNKAFYSERSKFKWPQSKHNSVPSLAVDVVPYPIDWEDMKRFYHFVGFVKAIAIRLHIKIRCGADWDNDNSFKDQSFHDLPHFELVQ